MSKNQTSQGLSLQPALYICSFSSSVNGIKSMKQAGYAGPFPVQPTHVVLELNGTVVAEGSIQSENGKTYFVIQEAGK
ncbi:hypothetical protein [Spirochaeta dissipatitropha]